MDFEELLSYTQQLQTQNKQLKKHIFNIQQQLNEKNELIQLITQKKEELNIHIKQCQNEIIKRQQRQLVLLSNIDIINKEMNIYIDEIGNLKDVINGLKQQGEVIYKNNFKISKLPPNPKSIQKCKNCQLLTVDKDNLINQLEIYKEKCYLLGKDMECIIHTFCIC